MSDFNPLGEFRDLADQLSKLIDRYAGRLDAKNVQPPLSSQTATTSSGGTVANVTGTTGAASGRPTSTAPDTSPAGDSFADSTDTAPTKATVDAPDAQPAQPVQGQHDPAPAPVVGETPPDTSSL